MKAGIGLAAVVLAAAIAGAAVAREAWREQALELTNAAREEEGLEPLALDDRLVAAAEAHAEDMLARDYYGHVSPEGETVRDRFSAAGGGEWRLVAENIAMCEGCPTPPDLDRVAAFHEGWMQSPEHRENILDPGLDSFGFAMAAGDGVVYAVQAFAGPGRPRGLAPGEPEEALSAAALAERALEALNRAREAEGQPPLAASEALDAAADRLVADGEVAEPEGGLMAALPPEAEGGWATLGVVTGECGGCGAVPTATDVDDFVGRWLEEPALAEALLDPAAGHLGFALSADGEGRKAAAAVAGERR